MADVIRGLVLPRQAVVQGLEPAPAQGFLDPLDGTTFQQQSLQRLAIEKVFRFKFRDGQPCSYRSWSGLTRTEKHRK